MIKKIYLLIELIALYIGLPMAYHRYARGGEIIPILLLAALVMIAVLLLSRSFDRKELWNARNLRGELKRMLITFAVLTGIATAGIAVTAPETLFIFARRMPLFWGIVMVFYPLLSVYPQEIIFRAFFFHRYRDLFPTSWVMVVMSGLGFGFAHVVFRNQVALLMSMAAGLIFSYTYHKTRSLAAVWFEHALYGCFVFTVGLGRFFFHGAIELPH